MNPINPLMASMPMPPTSNPSQDTPTSHGFFMLGTGTVFFYHSAQFTMEDHSYQMILTVTLPEDAMSAYVNDVKQNPSGYIWVFNNSVDFTLPQVQIGTVTSMTGSITRLSTNLQTSDTIVPSTTAAVQRLVYFRHFDYSQPYPDPLPYILFGDDTGAYVAHFLTKLEDFDNLAVLTSPPAWLAMEQLMAGCPIDFTSGVPYSPGTLPTSSPLGATTSYVVEFGGTSDPSFVVDVDSIYWFDTQIVNAPPPKNP